MDRATTAAVVVAVLTAAVTVLAPLVRRRLCAPAAPGGRAHGWVIGVGRRARRARVTADLGGLCVTVRGRPPFLVPSPVVDRPHPVTRKERLRIHEEFSVKLEHDGRRVFLQEEDWRNLSGRGGRAPTRR